MIFPSLFRTEVSHNDDGSFPLKFIWKLPDIVEIQFLIMTPGDRMGPQYGIKVLHLNRWGKSSQQELLDQKKGYLPESFLIWSRFKFVETMLKHRY